MRVFKTRAFNRWAVKAGISDTALLKAVADIESGLIDADLGLLVPCIFYLDLRRKIATTSPSVN